MFESLKRAFFAPRSKAADVGAVAEWARRRGFAFKRARGDDGFVVEGSLEGKPWRLEWGPAQRAYIDGRELRLRIEAKLPSSLQMLVLNRELVGVLEQQTFEDFTDAMQTHVGAKTPEEMRWLVMFPKLELADFGELRQHFVAVAGAPRSGRTWLGGRLGSALTEAVVQPAGPLHAAPPFVLMTLRGRVYLRMRLDLPDPVVIGAVLAIFETAVDQAAQVVKPGARDSSTAFQA